MKFLQELKSLHEGAVKGALEDAIAATIERLPVALLKQPYEEVVRQIAQKVQEKNPGVDIDLLMDMVKTQFEPDDLTESATHDWVNMSAEDMYEYAVENLSDDEMDALNDALVGLRVENPEDHEEAEQIISKFLNARDSVNNQNATNETVTSKKDAWEILNTLADERHGEFGFSTLDADDAARYINMKKADSLARAAGEYGFMTMSETDMKDLVLKHPELLKGVAKAAFSKFLSGRVSESSDGNWPKLIAHADEFRVEMDEDEQVHILDGEGAVRVSMPLVIWKQLCR